MRRFIPLILTAGFAVAGCGNIPKALTEYELPRGGGHYPNANGAMLSDPSRGGTGKTVSCPAMKLKDGKIESGTHPTSNHC